MTVIRRRDPTRKMARFYALGIQSALSGGWDLIREWGRIGSAGRVKAEHYSEASVAETAKASAERAKRRRGYG